MGHSGFRYHYVIQLREPPSIIEEKVRKQMRRNNPSDLRLRRSNKTLVLRFPSHESKLATPQMELVLKPDAQGGTVLRLVIGPSYGVWKFLKGMLLSCALCGSIGLVLTFMQWNNGSGVWGLYILLLGLSGWLFIYFVAEEGKRRGKDATELLKTFMHDALDVDLFELDRPTAVGTLASTGPEPT